MEFHFVCSLVKPWKMGTMLKDFQISANDSFSSNKQLNRSFFSISNSYRFSHDFIGD